MLNPGDILARKYQIVRLLGAGGMSNIYLCRIVGDPGPEKYWVVKEMSVHYQEAAEQATAIELFLQEGALLQRLDHRNLPKVVDRFFADGKYHFVMEYVDGEDLGKLISRNPQGLPENMVLPWAVEVATVLYYLHCQQPPIVFRDMKPSNIMISKGTVKLIDFGIARSFKPNKKKDTISIGSPGYAPPEQYSGQTDPRSDIYALGATLHHLLTGRDPTETRSPFKFESAHLIKPAVSQATSDILTRATDLDPINRYQSALDMKKALQAVAGIHTRPVARPYTAPATQMSMQVPPELGHRGPTGTTNIGPGMEPQAAPPPVASPVPPPPVAPPVPPPVTPVAPVVAPAKVRAPLNPLMSAAIKLIFCLVVAIGLRLGRDAIHDRLNHYLGRSTPTPTPAVTHPSGPLDAALTMLDNQQPALAAAWLTTWLVDHPDDVEARLWLQNATAVALGGPVPKVALALSPEPGRRLEEERGALLAAEELNAAGTFIELIPQSDTTGTAPADITGVIGDRSQLVSWARQGVPALSLTPAATEDDISLAPPLDASWQAMAGYLLRAHLKPAVLVVTQSGKLPSGMTASVDGLTVTVQSVANLSVEPGKFGAVLLLVDDLAAVARRIVPKSAKGTAVWSLDPSVPDPLPDGLMSIAEWWEDPAASPAGYAFALRYRTQFKAEPTVWARRASLATTAMARALGGSPSREQMTPALRAARLSPADIPTWYVLKLQKGAWHLVDRFAAGAR